MSGAKKKSKRVGKAGRKKGEKRAGPVEMMTLSDLEQLKILADPLRIRILQALGEERTTKQVADHEQRPTERVVRPLGLWFWGKVWTLVAWCELRDDFRMFRLDRIAGMENGGAPFRSERGKTLADFYRTMESPDCDC